LRQVEATKRIHRDAVRFGRQLNPQQNWTLIASQDEACGMMTGRMTPYERQSGRKEPANFAGQVEARDDFRYCLLTTGYSYRYQLSVVDTDHYGASAVASDSLQ
jgi:hypothetical protein